MKRLVKRYVRKRVWECASKYLGPHPSDCDEIVEWVMKGYPFHWRTRLWAATKGYNRGHKSLYEWLISR